MRAREWIGWGGAVVIVLGLWTSGARAGDPGGSEACGARAGQPARPGAELDNGPAMVAPIARALMARSRQMRRLGLEEAARTLEGMSRDLSRKARAWAEQMLRARRGPGEPRAHPRRRRAGAHPGRRPGAPERLQAGAAPEDRPARAPRGKGRARAKGRPQWPAGKAGNASARRGRPGPLAGPSPPAGSPRDRALRARIHKLEQELRALRARLREAPRAPARPGRKKKGRHPSGTPEHVRTI